LRICLSCPSAITSASPRPATSSASVATIGCNPTNATSEPFSSPATAPATRAIRTAGHTPNPRYSGITAAASAITDPTDRSTPSLPITSAMPSATITTGATCTSWVRRLAVSMKLSVNRALKTRRTTTAP
jgi:hypothetical protein